MAHPFCGGPLRGEKNDSVRCHNHHGREEQAQCRARVAPHGATRPGRARRASDAAGTLTWTGWIMGITPLATVLTAPLWGRWAERGNPKTLYAVVQVAQGLAFLGTAVARTLIELFLCRIVLGVTGAASTFAFVSAGRSDDPRDVRRQVAAIQSGMTIGQVIGPLVGAIAAARLGFRASFVLGAVILFGCGALVRWGVPDRNDGAASGASAARPNWR